jgi:hypothetical protein
VGLALFTAEGRGTAVPSKGNTANGVLHVGSNELPPKMASFRSGTQGGVSGTILFRPKQRPQEFLQNLKGGLHFSDISAEIFNLGVGVSSFPEFWCWYCQNDVQKEKKTLNIA